MAVTSSTLQQTQSQSLLSQTVVALDEVNTIIANNSHDDQPTSHLSNNNHNIQQQHVKGEEGSVEEGSRNSRPPSPPPITSSSSFSINGDNKEERRETSPSLPSDDHQLTKDSLLEIKKEKEAIVTVEKVKTSSLPSDLLSAVKSEVEELPPAEESSTPMMITESNNEAERSKGDEEVGGGVGGGAGEEEEDGRKGRKKRTPSILKALDVKLTSAIVRGVDNNGEDLDGARYRTAARVAKSKLNASGRTSRQSNEEGDGMEAFVQPALQPKGRRGGGGGRKGSSKTSNTDSSSAAGMDGVVVIGSKSESTTTTTAAADVQLEWVQCDRCNKWRSIGNGVSQDSLPEVWYCELSTWSTVYNSCDAPEEEDTTTTTTTSAVVTANVSSSSNAPMISKEEVDKISSNGTEVAKATPRKGGGKGSRVRRNLDSNSSLVSMNNNAQEGNTRSNEMEDASLAAALQAGAGMQTRPRRQAKTTLPPSGLQQNANGNANLQSSGGGNGGSAINWVQCNKCKKWRKVAENVPLASLPEKWFCTLNTWSAFNKCSARQEEDDTPQNGGGGAGGSASTRASSGRKGGNNTNSNMSSTVTLDNGVKVQQINWVRCEHKNCKKWRKVPPHVDMSTLPEKWYCEYNTWDLDSANCDAPEDSDSEAEGGAGGGSKQNNGLVMVNSKGAMQLSYRRIIYGNDGKVRTCFSDKNRLGYGIYSYILPHRVVDSEDPHEPARRLAYWWSSAYDDSKALAAAQLALSQGKKKAAQQQENAPPQLPSTTQLLEENSSFYLLEGIQRYARHQLQQQQAAAAKKKKMSAAATSDLGSSSAPPSSSSSSSSSSSLGLHPSVVVTSSEEQSRETFLSNTTSSRPHSLPKKWAKSIQMATDMPLFDRMHCEENIIRSALLSATGTTDQQHIHLTELYDLIKNQIHLPNQQEEVIRSCLGLDNLKVILRRLEVKDEVEVAYTAHGQVVITSLPPLATVIEEVAKRRESWDRRINQQQSVEEESWQSASVPLKMRKFFKPNGTLAPAPPPPPPPAPIVTTTGGSSRQKQDNSGGVSGSFNGDITSSSSKPAATPGRGRRSNHDKEKDKDHLVSGSASASATKALPRRQSARHLNSTISNNNNNNSGSVSVSGSGSHAEEGSVTPIVAPNVMVGKTTENEDDLAVAQTASAMMPVDKTESIEEDRISALVAAAAMASPQVPSSSSSSSYLVSSSGDDVMQLEEIVQKEEDDDDDDNNNNNVTEAEAAAQQIELIKDEIIKEMDDVMMDESMEVDVVDNDEEKVDDHADPVDRDFFSSPKQKDDDDNDDDVQSTTITSEKADDDWDGETESSRNKILMEEVEGELSIECETAWTSEQDQQTDEVADREANGLDGQSPSPPPPPPPPDMVIDNEQGINENHTITALATTNDSEREQEELEEIMMGETRATTVLSHETSASSPPPPPPSPPPEEKDMIMESEEAVVDSESIVVDELSHTLLREDQVEKEECEDILPSAVPIPLPGAGEGEGVSIGDSLQSEVQQTLSQVNDQVEPHVTDRPKDSMELSSGQVVADNDNAGKEESALLSLDRSSSSSAAKSNTQGELLEEEEENEALVTSSESVTVHPLLPMESSPSSKLLRSISLHDIPLIGEQHQQQGEAERSDLLPSRQTSSSQSETPPPPPPLPSSQEEEEEESKERAKMMDSQSPGPAL
eukprot:scaffold1172_cov180-Ochromonas_danica.AAC.39